MPTCLVRVCRRPKPAKPRTTRTARMATEGHIMALAWLHHGARMVTSWPRHGLAWPNLGSRWASSWPRHGLAWPHHGSRTVTLWPPARVHHGPGSASRRLIMAPARPRMATFWPLYGRFVAGSRALRQLHLSKHVVFIVISKLFLLVCLL